MRLRGEVCLRFSYYLNFTFDFNIPFYSQGPSLYGQHFFIGCSAWKKTEKDKHRYLAIPRNVNEDLLSKIMDGNGALPDSKVTSTRKCSLTVHPKVGLKFCRKYIQVLCEFSIANIKNNLLSLLTSRKWEISKSKDGAPQMPSSDAHFCAC
jgi:hypothetical protein